jgi:hypothetical protein
MRDLLVLFIHFIATLARLLRPALACFAATLPLSLCRKRGNPLIDRKNRRRTRKQVRHQFRMQTCLGVSTCIGENCYVVVFIRRQRKCRQDDAAGYHTRHHQMLDASRAQDLLQVIAAEGAVSVLVHNNLIVSGLQDRDQSACIGWQQVLHLDECKCFVAVRNVTVSARNFTLLNTTGRPAARPAFSATAARF